MHKDSVQWKVEVDKKDIAYIVSIFEGYDDLAVVRTLDPSSGLIELMISPDFLEDVRRLTEALSKEIPFHLIWLQKVFARGGRESLWVLGNSVGLSIYEPELLPFFNSKSIPTARSSLTLIVDKGVNRYAFKFFATV